MKISSLEKKRSKKKHAQQTATLFALHAQPGQQLNLRRPPLLERS
jgi:hypothetical protein